MADQPLPVDPTKPFYPGATIASGLKNSLLAFYQNPSKQTIRALLTDAQLNVPEKAFPYIQKALQKFKTGLIRLDESQLGKALRKVISEKIPGATKGIAAGLGQTLESEMTAAEAKAARATAGRAGGLKAATVERDLQAFTKALASKNPEKAQAIFTRMAQRLNLPKGAGDLVGPAAGKPLQRAIQEITTSLPATPARAAKAARLGAMTVFQAYTGAATPKDLEKLDPAFKRLTKAVGRDVASLKSKIPAGVQKAAGKVKPATLGRVLKEPIAGTAAMMRKHPWLPGVAGFAAGEAVGGVVKTGLEARERGLARQQENERLAERLASLLPSSSQMVREAEIEEALLQRARRVAQSDPGVLAHLASQYRDLPRSSLPEGAIMLGQGGVGGEQAAGQPDLSQLPPELIEQLLGA